MYCRLSVWKCHLFSKNNHWSGKNGTEQQIVSCVNTVLKYRKKKKKVWITCENEASSLADPRCDVALLWNSSSRHCCWEIKVISTCNRTVHTHTPHNLCTWANNTILTKVHMHAQLNKNSNRKVQGQTHRDAPSSNKAPTLAACEGSLVWARRESTVLRVWYLTA